MNIILCLLATRKYKSFVQSLLDDVKKHFLLNHEIEVNLFIDEIGEYYGDERVRVLQTLIVSHKFPEITLFRYRIMTSKHYEADFVYYMDVDMEIRQNVGDEIFGDIVAVRHPGFFRGGGSWGNKKESTSYTYPENRIHYFAGGFQGGSNERYYRLMQQLSRDIDADEKNNVKAEWQDETYFNRALSEMKNFTVLNPSYCMVEQKHLQLEWGISQFPEIIVALSKNHEEIRN